MAFQIHAENISGAFQEKDTGNWFEFSENPEMILSPPAHGGRNTVFPHIIWTGDGYRYAKVGKTVVHIITDETEIGWVVEKWYIKNRREYAK